MRDPFVQQPEGEEEDLWLVSYADLLTLLIAFFALLVAGSRLNAKALETAASAMGIRSEASSDPLQKVRSELDALIAENAVKDVSTSWDADGLGIVLGDALLFDIGSDALRPDARPWLEKVAGHLRPLQDRRIVIEGHSDDQPIRTQFFASNWELSAARALKVLHVLEQAGIPRNRLSVRSFAETRPATTEGPPEQRRASNRRVVIRVE